MAGKTPPSNTSAESEHGAAPRARAPAQWYGYIVGAALLLLGLLGFTADATFDTEATDPTGGGFQGDGFLGLEVNGTHNLLHVITGILLLALARGRPSARAAAIGLGAFYAVITIVGLADGDNVLRLIPVNPADNVLHAVLALAGLGAGLSSERTST